jgi:hypothetical protein
MSGQIYEPGTSRIQSSTAHQSVKGEVLTDIYILQYVCTYHLYTELFPMTARFHLTFMQINGDEDRHDRKFSRFDQFSADQPSHTIFELVHLEKRRSNTRMDKQARGA